MNRIPSHLVSHYLRLGLTPPVTRAEISAAYRAAALKHHPDRGGRGTDFAAITDSYNQLMRGGGNGEYYRPASLRSFVDSRSDEPNPFSGIFTAIVVPSLIGVLVGVRLIYFGGERQGLRAGGVSRCSSEELHQSTKEVSRQQLEQLREQQRQGK